MDIGRFRMRHVPNSEYRELRDLRVSENEGGPPWETLAAGCAIILLSALCSVVSCFVWPTVCDSGSQSAPTAQIAPVGRRMLRRRMIFECCVLIIPFQLLLSSGASFSISMESPSVDRDGLTASASHPLFLVPFISRGLALPASFGESPQSFTVEVLLWVLLALLLATSVSRLIGHKGGRVPESAVGAANAWRQDFAVYRGSLMLLTCMSILAVDFSFFPSRFMKTEAFGVSLMDIGVASFMLSSGIAGVPKTSEMNALLTRWVYAAARRRAPKSVVSLSSSRSPAVGLAAFLRETKMAKRAQGGLHIPDSDAVLDVIPPSERLQKLQQSILAGYRGEGDVNRFLKESDTSQRIDSETRRQSFHLVGRFLKPSLMLTCLGLCRTSAVYTFDHPQHVTEYGVHWNFFFTLAALPVAYLLLSAVSISISLIWGIAEQWLPSCWASKDVSRVLQAHVFRTCLCVLVHQLALSRSGLTQFILNDDRNGFFASNKEGICTLFGFTAIYSAGIDVGTVLRGSVQYCRGVSMRRRTFLFAGFLLSISAFIFCELFVQRASRRLCNSAFIFFSLGFNLLSGFCLACIPNTVEGLRPKAVVLDSINDNQLVVFLVSNLLVGLLNQATQTFFISTLSAHAITLGYTLYGCVLAWKLKRSGIVLK